MENPHIQKRHVGHPTELKIALPPRLSKYLLRALTPFTVLAR